LGPSYSFDGGPLGVGSHGHRDRGSVFVHAGHGDVGLVHGGSHYVLLFHFLEYANNGVGVGLVMFVVIVVETNLRPFILRFNRR
jgi:hypothetical protein